MRVLGSRSAKTLPSAVLRTSSSSGHGIGTALTETINQEVDVFAFLFERLGMTYKQPSAARGQ